MVDGKEFGRRNRLFQGSILVGKTQAANEGLWQTAIDFIAAKRHQSVVSGQWSVVISGDGWFYDFGDSNRAFKRDCTVYTGY